MDLKSKNASAPKASRKRKGSRANPKGNGQDSSSNVDKRCKSKVESASKSDKAEQQKGRKIKRTYERKSSQCPAPLPAEVSTSRASHLGLANGGEGSASTLCQAEARSGGPRLETGPGERSRHDGKDTVTKRRRKAGQDGKLSREALADAVKQSAPPGRNQRPQNAERTPEPTSKDRAPKKGLPVYTPGSQEEQWNLQIVDKGRVTCPRCKTVSRKTVDGLKKHMANCKVNPFTCQHCGKQLKSLTGMKYHIMAEHKNMPMSEDNEQDDQSVKENLRKVLKRMGKLKCSNEGCGGSFTSITGYLYHTRKCGKEESELEKLVLNCRHCGKAYRSRAGLEYHVKSEHSPSPLKAQDDEKMPPKQELDPERTPSGRVKRVSAQVAIFHLQEIASEELLKEWPKRKVQQDLVPDDKKLKYARPGLPAFSQEVLRKWKNEVKLQHRVQCPNQGCDSVYSSVSGLKAHLGLCSRGDFEAGKYKCLICEKEFSSESGVKYHINSIHSQDWFIVSSKPSKSFEKLLKRKLKEDRVKASAEQNPSLRFTPEPKGWPDRKAKAGPVSSVKATLGTIEGERKSKEALSGREKDCYDFSGSDSPSSSSSSSSSSSESEADEPEPPKVDKWALKRPVAQSNAAKQAKSAS
nr:zinc finger protein 512 isoform X2 [Paramormyrops kingsleyae]